MAHKLVDGLQFQGIIGERLFLSEGQEARWSLYIGRLPGTSILKKTDTGGGRKHVSSYLIMDTAAKQRYLRGPLKSDTAQLGTSATGVLTWKK